MRLAGKTAIVTGAGSGFGAGIARKFVAEGARVMVADINAEAAKTIADEIGGIAQTVDVANAQSVQAMAQAAFAAFGTLDILVNNAGVTWGEPYETFPHKAWEKVMNINVAGMFTLTRNLTGLLKAAATDGDPSRIINIGSVMGTIPLAEGAYSYAVSKGAVHHLTKILASELAAKNITVNAFAPGPFPSKMTAFAIGSEEGQAKVGANVPIGRVGSPADIAGATLFLCGRGGAYTSGAIIPLDGGMSVEASQNLFANAMS